MLVQFCRDKLLLIVWVFLAVGMLTTGLVLPCAYVHWMDDVMINEFGRFPIGVRELSWNMNWYPVPLLNEQTSIPFYLGGVIHECAYRLMGHLGPRVVVYACFITLVSLIYLYLKRKTCNQCLSALFALLYFAYPLQAASVRGARVDAIAIMFVMLAVWLMQFRPKQLSGRAVLWAVIGGLSVISVCVWMSAALLAPLAIWEMVEWHRTSSCKLSDAGIDCGFAILGAGVTMAVLFVPFYGHFTDMYNALCIVLKMSAAEHVTKSGQLIQVFKMLCAFPGFLILGAVVLLFSRRCRLMAVLTLAEMFVCCWTANFYENRMIYFVPIFLVGVAMFIGECRYCSLRRFVFTVVIGCTLLSYGRTCVVRTLTDALASGLRDYGDIQKTMKDQIARGAKVYCSTFQLYYVGRDLGWQMYRASGSGVLPPEGEFLDCDYCIFDQGAVNCEVLNRMKNRGFVDGGVVCERKQTRGYLIAERIGLRKKLSPVLGPYRLFCRRGR